MSFETSFESLRRSADRIILPLASAGIVSGCMPSITAPDIVQTVPHQEKTSIATQEKSAVGNMPPLDIHLYESTRSLPEHRNEIRSAPIMMLISEFGFSSHEAEIFNTYGWALFRHLQEITQNREKKGNPKYGFTVNSLYIRDGAKVCIEYEATPSAPLSYDADVLRRTFETGMNRPIEFVSDKEQANTVLHILDPLHIVFDDGSDISGSIVNGGKYGSLYDIGSQQIIPISIPDINAILPDYTISPEATTEIQKQLMTWLFAKALGRVAGLSDLPTETRSFMSSEPQLSLTPVHDEITDAPTITSSDGAKYTFQGNVVDPKNDIACKLLQAQEKIYGKVVAAPIQGN